MLGEKFTFTIETRHFADRGEQENVHNLTPEQLKKREVDFIDIAADKVEQKDYKKEEDPTLVRSEKANRGPLDAKGEWKGKDPMMCCYKLVTVEFKMFGLQGKVESFLQNFERNLFLKFHRQVYCWLDDWFGMSIDDVREYEAKTKTDLDDKIKTGEKGEKGEEPNASTSLQNDKNEKGKEKK